MRPATSQRMNAFRLERRSSSDGNVGSSDDGAGRSNPTFEPASTASLFASILSGSEWARARVSQQRTLPDETPTWTVMRRCPAPL